MGQNERWDRPSLYKVAQGGMLFQAASIFVVVLGDAEQKRLHKFL